jgi:mannose/fructose/N-acetylgalactosamine-specific phosphotransferase system component IIB
LLKFTSDVTTLVLIRGSNLDALVDDKAINLTDRGFQRHRILWVREMAEAELRQVGEGGPTIDRIEVGECESGEEMREWLKKEAPAFIR